tara:strand:- start:10306 stop:10911 length:606 start_codon:yes stop_codon:yes gene_type:complete
MKALLVFSSDNEHPLNFLLNKKRRHVFVCLCTKNAWVIYDWRMGLPIVESISSNDFDLASFYRDDGYEVLEIETGTHTSYGPTMMNNCVGHAKLVTGTKSMALVPNGLYKHFTRGSLMERILSYIKMFTVVPGFGGGAPAPAPPPPPPAPAPVAKKASKDVQTARRAEQKAARLAAGQSGTNKTGSLISTADATTTNTLLG